MSINFNRGTRRGFLIGAGGVGLAAPLGLLGVSQAKPLARTKATANLPPTKMRIGWLAAGTCIAPVPLAKAKGFYEKYNLDVELVDYRIGFKSPTKEMLSGPANGQTDAVVAMVYNFMRPMAEDGLKLKFVTGVHGGCVRVMGSKTAGVTTLESLRGKTLAMPGELRGEDAIQLFPAMLKSWGLRPEKDIFFLWGPDRLNPEVVRSGKAQAYMQVDPIIYKAQRENPDLVEIINNQTGPWADKTCCVVAASDDYIANNSPALTALAFALEDATAYMMSHYEEAAAIYAKESMFEQQDIVATLQRMDNHAHRVNHDMRDDIAFYAASLKAIGGFNDPNLDPKAFADRVTAQVVC